MISQSITAWVALAALLATGGSPAPQETKATYVVVVHANNPLKVSADTAKVTVKKLFLKNLTQWPDGTSARPYARTSTSAEQAAFVKDLLGMNDAELARHWLKIKNMNGSTPPKNVASDRMLLKYVARHHGAVGFVEKSAAAKAKGVRVLFEF